jgi:hypothetical protein
MAGEIQLSPQAAAALESFAEQINKAYNPALQTLINIGNEVLEQHKSGKRVFIAVSSLSLFGLASAATIDISGLLGDSGTPTNTGGGDSSGV